MPSGVSASITSTLASSVGITKMGDGTLHIMGDAPDVTVLEGTLILASTGTAQNLTVEEATTAIVNGNGGTSVQGDLINNGTLIPGGDLDGNGLINATDIDLLYQEIGRSEGHVDPRFDLAADGALDQRDVDELVYGILNREYGDADLDGDIDFTDLIALAMHFDPLGVHPDSGWAEGDFDGDAEVDIGDFNYIAVNFAPLGYETSAMARAEGAAATEAGLESAVEYVVELEHAEQPAQRPTVESNQGVVSSSPNGEAPIPTNARKIPSVAPMNWAVESDRESFSTRRSVAEDNGEEGSKAVFSRKSYSWYGPDHDWISTG